MSAEANDLEPVKDYYRKIAPFMDAELAEREDTSFWRSLGREFARRRILEIGSGTGRVTALLAEAGAEVFAVDVSQELMEVAARRFKKASNVHLVIGDMRQLPFGGPFDVVVAADDPFSHLLVARDRERVLKAIARILAPDGVFVLDALHVRVRKSRKPGTSKPFVETSSRVVPFRGSELEIAERWQYAQIRPVGTAHYDYTLDERHVASASFRARYWIPAEIRRRLQSAGLKSEAWWGNYEREPWNARRSEKLIIRARRGI